MKFLIYLFEKLSRMVFLLKLFVNENTETEGIYLYCGFCYTKFFAENNCLMLVKYDQQSLQIGY